MAMNDKTKKELAKDGGGGGLGSLGGYSMPSGGGGSAANQRISSSNMPNNSGPRISLGGISSPVGTVYGASGIPVGGGSASFGVNPLKGGSVGANLRIPLGRAKGGTVKNTAEGGSVASKRADGRATKGKTNGRWSW